MIEIRNLSFSYGKKQVFRDLSLTVGDGATCLRGPSGSGKTTLLRLIGGLERPDSGSFEGVPSPVSFLFQEDRLLPWFSILDNVMAAIPGNGRSEARKWLEAVELGAEVPSLPGSLSGGQQRRVALARALARPCGLLLLDEPFRGLDEPLIRRLLPLIAEHGVPVIFSTHSELEAEVLRAAVIEI